MYFSYAEEGEFIDLHQTNKYKEFFAFESYL